MRPLLVGSQILGYFLRLSLTPMSCRRSATLTEQESLRRAMLETCGSASGWHAKGVPSRVID
jgi:hypothetical protein